MAEEYSTFDEIPIGKKFKTAAGITYTKLSKKECQVYRNAKGDEPSVKKIITNLYNTKVQLKVL